MADRTLTWHEKDIVGDTRIGPTYYIDATYEPLAVRLYAEKVSTDGDLEVDVFSDGVSIFSNKAVSIRQSPSRIGATVIADPADTTASLASGQSAEELAGNFNTDTIEVGSWVHCEIKNLRGGKNVSVHLELLRISEEDEV